MTYIISLALMAAGLVLLTWTLIAALRLRREREDISFSGIAPAFMPLPTREEYVGTQESLVDDGRHNHSDWYQLQCTRSRGVRYAPDMGGFTEVPLQLHDAYDNRMYVRKRIWMN